MFEVLFCTMISRAEFLTFLYILNEVCLCNLALVEVSGMKSSLTCHQARIATRFDRKKKKTSATMISSLGAHNVVSLALSTHDYVFVGLGSKHVRCVYFEYFIC